MIARTHWRKVFRDVLSRKARTALVSLSIFFGVLGVVTIVSGSDLLTDSIQERFAEDKLSMLFAAVEVDDDVELTPADDAATLESLHNYPGVTVVEGWATQQVLWMEPGDRGFLQGRVLTFSEDWEDLQIIPVQLIDGAFPSPESQELVIERRMSERYDLSPGDSLVLHVFGAATGSRDETWTISGVVYHPYMGDSGNTGLYVNRADFAHITDVTRFTHFNVRFTDFLTAVDQQEAFGEWLDDETVYHHNFIATENPANHPVLEEMDSWISTLTALSLVAMLVASLLVVTVILTIVIEQKGQIGVMKSLGATRLDLFMIYGGIALVYGIIGMVPGVMIGAIGGYLLADKTALLANSLVDGFGLSPVGLALGAVLGLVMPLVAAIIPVWLGTRVTILDAITDFGISSSFGRGRISGVIGRLPLPLSVRQGLANVYTKKSRLAMTGLTLTLAVAVFMGVTGVFISLQGVIDEVFETFNYDIAVIPIQPDEYDYAEVGALIAENVDGVETVHPAFDLWVEGFTDSNPHPDDKGHGFFLSGFDPNTDSIQFELEAGEGWERDPGRRGLVLTKNAAEELGVWVGDTVTVRADVLTLRLEVIGIHDFPFQANFARWQTVATLVQESSPDEYWLRFDGHVTGAEAERRIVDIREALLKADIVAVYENQVAFAEDQSQTILSIGLIFNIASLVMAAVGAVGLLTMLFISVYERQREIGVMRSVGASSRTIAGQFLGEGLLIGLLAWVIGLPLSYGLGVGLSSALPVGDVGFNYPLIAPVIGLIGMLVVATVASLWPSLSAARRTVSDILRYQ